MVTFTINIPPMLVYIPYMDPMGIIKWSNSFFDISSLHTSRSLRATDLLWSSYLIDLPSRPGTVESQVLNACHSLTVGQCFVAAGVQHVAAWFSLALSEDIAIVNSCTFASRRLMFSAFMCVHALRLNLQRIAVLVHIWVHSSSEWSFP